MEKEKQTAVGLFDLLPNEIRYPIFSQLHLKTAILSSRVCKSWKNDFDQADELIWKCIILNSLGSSMHKNETQTFRSFAVSSAKIFVSMKTRAKTLITLNKSDPRYTSHLAKLIYWLAQVGFIVQLKNVWKEFELDKCSLLTFNQQYSQYGSNPFHIAARYGNIDVIKFLIKKNYPIHAKSRKKGMKGSATEIALFNNRIDVVELMMNEINSTKNIESIKRRFSELSLANEDIECINVNEKILQIAATTANYKLFKNLYPIVDLYKNINFEGTHNNDIRAIESVDKFNLPLIYNVLSSGNINFIRKVFEKYNPDFGKIPLGHVRYDPISYICKCREFKNRIEVLRYLLFDPLMIERYHLSEMICADQAPESGWPLLFSFENSDRELISFLCNEVGVPIYQYSPPDPATIIHVLLQCGALKASNTFIEFYIEKLKFQDKMTNDQKENLLKVLWKGDECMLTPLHYLLERIGLTCYVQDKDAENEDIIVQQGVYPDRGEFSGKMKENRKEAWNLFDKMFEVANKYCIKESDTPRKPQPLLWSILIDCPTVEDTQWVVIDQKQIIKLIEKLIEIDPIRIEQELSFVHFSDQIHILTLAIKLHCWDIVDWLLEEVNGKTRINLKYLKFDEHTKEGGLFTFAKLIFPLKEYPRNHSKNLQKEFEERSVKLFYKLTKKFGLDVNERNSLGMTPIMYCRDILIATLFISNGADLNLVDNNGWTVLHHFVSNIPNYKFLNSVLSKGLDKFINTETFGGGEYMTPLAVVATQWEPDREDDLIGVVCVLVAHGADLDRVYMDVGNHPQDIHTERLTDLLLKIEHFTDEYFSCKFIKIQFTISFE